MAIKYIIDNEAVMARMGLPNVEGVAETIDSHLTAAHLRFQSLLETTFEPSVSSDIFWLEEGRYPKVVDKYFRLRLKKGFVKPNFATAIIADDPTMASSVQLIAPEVMVDYAKGIVYVSEIYANKYVTVTYISGFDADNKAPDWLKEAVLAYMPFLLNNQQATNRSKEQEGMAVKIADVSGDMVAPYMRGAAFQYRPIF